MPLPDPSSLLNDFNPAAACQAADALRDLASQSPAGLLDQLGGQDFLNGIPSNLVSQLTPMLQDALPAELLGLTDLAAGAMNDTAQLQKLAESLPQSALDKLGLPAGSPELMKLVKDNIPSFLADQIPNLAQLAQMAGLPGIPKMPNLPNLPGLPGLPAMPALPAIPGLPAGPAGAAGLVNSLRNQAAGLYQNALNQIPQPPVPRILPENVPLPDPTDLANRVASCTDTAGMTHEEKVEQALAMAPPLPPEVAETLGAPSDFANDFVGGMGEVMATMNQCPGIVQEAAGMMSLLGGPSVPINEVTQGLQGMTEAYGSTVCNGMQSMQDLANAGQGLQNALTQMPADALGGLL